MDLRRASRADGDRKGGQTLIGFPALIDKGTHVEIEVFDEPEVARDKHRAGLRRLLALQIREALKFLESNVPDLHEDVGALPAARQRGGAARADRRSRDRARLPRRTAAERRSAVRATARGRPRPAESDRARSRAPAGVVLVELAASAEQAQGRAAAEGGCRRHRAAARSASFPSASSRRRPGRDCSTCRAT